MFSVSPPPPNAYILLHAMGQVVRSWAPLRGRVVALAEPMLSRSLEANGSPLPHAMRTTPRPWRRLLPMSVEPPWHRAGLHVYLK